MPSLYEQIQAKFNNSQEIGDAPYNEGRKLDEMLAERIKPYLAQYNDGLISAAEFVDYVAHSADSE